VRLRVPSILLLLLTLLIGVAAGALPANAAGDQPKPLTSRRLFDQSRPGVQLITARFTAQIVLPEPEVTAANQRALQALLTGRIRRGQIPASGPAVESAFIDELARNPFRWMTPSSRVRRENVKLTLTGSGFSITPDGYIVTNAHVVAPRDEDLKAAFISEDMRNGTDDFIASVVQEGLTQRQATKLLGVIVRWATSTAKLANFRRQLAAFASSGTRGLSTSRPRPATLVDAGDRFPGKDVAVLKVSASNMATVPLGDDTALSTGDRLYVLGFPGPATFNPVLSKASQKEPTLTQGVLSAKKGVSGGYTVLQTDAAMTHGNSGGPIFDEQGMVVGVATFGSVDPETGREVAGLNFAVPVSIVSGLLSKAHVKAAEGTAGGKYRLALDAFDKQWYKRALPLFEQVKALDPGHPLVRKLIRDSQTAIGQGRDRTPVEILGLPRALTVALAGTVVLLTAAVLGTALLRRRRRRRRAVPGQAAPGMAVQPVQPGPVPFLYPDGPRRYPDRSPYPARPSPAAALEGRQAPEAPEERDWWTAQPLAPVSPTANGGAAADAGESGTEGRAGAFPAWQAGGEPVTPGRAETVPAGQAGGDAPERQRVHYASPPLVCPSCGHPNPPTDRYCEQCWTVLRS